MNLDDFHAVLAEHFGPRASAITRFAATRYSFEEWFNWELFSAFSFRGFTCHPKPAYRQTFAPELAGQLGDLLIEGSNGERWLIEVALVHAFTQDKWRAKLINDRLKLEGARREAVRKLQLVVYCSHSERDLHEAWDYWFAEVPFWAEEPNHHLVLKDDAQGEVCMKFWEVD